MSQERLNDAIHRVSCLRSGRSRRGRGLRWSSALACLIGQIVNVRSTAFTAGHGAAKNLDEVRVRPRGAQARAARGSPVGLREVAGQHLHDHRHAAVAAQVGVGQEPRRAGQRRRGGPELPQLDELGVLDGEARGHEVEADAGGGEVDEQAP